MNQLGPSVDKKLNVISRKLGAVDKLQAKAEAVKTEAWEQVFSFMDELEAERFIASDGYVLAKQRRSGTSKIDEAKLKQLIFAKFTSAKATRLWNSITDQRLNSTFLEVAVQQKKIPASIVDECITTAEDSFARVRREWTKDDGLRTQVLDIEKREPTDEEVKALMIGIIEG